MNNPWMTYQIQADNYNLRLVALGLLYHFRTEKFQGCIEVVEMPEEDRLFIQTSNKCNADTVADFLANSDIKWH